MRMLHLNLKVIVIIKNASLIEHLIELRHVLIRLGNSKIKLRDIKYKTMPVFGLF